MTGISNLVLENSEGKSLLSFDFLCVCGKTEIVRTSDFQANKRIIYECPNCQKIYSAPYLTIYPGRTQLGKSRGELFAQIASLADHLE